MPRKPRIDEPGLCHHVIARGIEKRHIYCNEQDRRFFLTRLCQLARETKTRIYAFTLIPNHFHLLIQRTSTPISIFMQRLLTSYALYFNREHERSGHLFQNRYKSFPCTDDSYFPQLIRYISLNPIRAGLVNTLEDLAKYPYSSHSHILRPAQDEWLSVRLVLAHFGEKEQMARRAYLKFVADGLGMINAGDPTPGSPGKGIEEIRAFTTSSSDVDLDQDLDDNLDDDLDSIMQDICLMYSLTGAELLGTGRRRNITRARSHLAFRMSSEIGLSGSEIGRRLSVTRSAASKLIKRGGKLLAPGD